LLGLLGCWGPVTVREWVRYSSVEVQPMYRYGKITRPGCRDIQQKNLTARIQNPKSAAC